MPVLNAGHVMLIAAMGSDDSIVRAARTSYGPGTKSVSQDAALIHYLLEHDHSSPFEMVELSFHIKLPLFVLAQLIRHRTANINSMSARYSVMPDEFYFPESWRLQSATNKQGSANASVENAAISEAFKTQCETAYKQYEWMLEQGVSRELARMILPQNLYTQIVWKTDLRNLFHFLRLRLDEHAQQEIRVYAECMLKAAEAIAPIATSAFKKYVLNAKKFSATEMELLRALAAEHGPALHQQICNLPLSARQQKALQAKLGLEDLNDDIPI
jgi:thymidylate synthase (FAD)